MRRYRTLPANKSLRIKILETRNMERASLLRLIDFSTFYIWSVCDRVDGTSAIDFLKLMKRWIHVSILVWSNQTLKNGSFQLEAQQ